MKCIIDIRKELYADAVLPSGTTMFQVAQWAHDKELTALTPITRKTVVVAPTE